MAETSTTKGINLARIPEYFFTAGLRELNALGIPSITAPPGIKRVAFLLDIATPGVFIPNEGHGTQLLFRNPPWIGLKDILLVLDPPEIAKPDRPPAIYVVIDPNNLAARREVFDDDLIGRISLRVIFNAEQKTTTAISTEPGTPRAEGHHEYILEIQALLEKRRAALDAFDKACQSLGLDF